MKASNWTPAFAGETNIRKAWFFVVIPAEAGIQDDLKKMKSMSISKKRIYEGNKGDIFYEYYSRRSRRSLR